jgi:hypothetical protein
MAIFFGGSSLLVQQKLMDYYSLLDLEKEKKDLDNLPNKVKEKFVYENLVKFADDENVEPNKKKYEEIKEKIQKRIFNSLFIFGLSNLIGYAGKYGIGLGVAYYKKKYYPNNKEKFNNTIYNLNEKEQNYNFDFNNPLISENNETIVNSSDFELNQNIFVFIGIIYFFCIIISILLYWLLLCCFFQKTQEENKDQQKITQEIKTKEIKGDNLEDIEEEEDEDKNDEGNKNEKEKEKEKKRLEGCCLCIKINEMCGNIIYFERINLGQNKNSKACCRLFIESINNYFCNLCCCCYRYEKIHFEKNKQCFCYCYQEKGFCDYLNEFVVNDVQRQIVFCVILYFISKLATIGTKNNYENILENSNILEEMLYFIFSLAGTFFILTVFIIGVLDKCKCCSKKKNVFDPNKGINDFITKINNHTNDICFKYLKKFNKTLIVMIYIFIFIVLFGFVHTTLSIGKKSQIRISLYLTVLTNAYFAFLL